MNGIDARPLAFVPMLQSHAVLDCTLSASSTSAGRNDIRVRILPLESLTPSLMCNHHQVRLAHESILLQTQRGTLEKELLKTPAA
jgi:hypothetical protein